MECGVWRQVGVQGKPPGARVGGAHVHVLRDCSLVTALGLVLDKMSLTVHLR